MNKLLERAKELQPELVENRRWLHSHAEVGFELTETCAFVEEKLRELGYEPRRMSKAGVVATLGKPGGKTILLRADMDALPMKEESGLAFAAKGDAAHTCGHDLHTAMLLGAAKLLKEHESELNGCVKLMFQPDEEGTNPWAFPAARPCWRTASWRTLMWTRPSPCTSGPTRPIPRAPSSPARGR